MGAASTPAKAKATHRIPGARSLIAEKPGVRIRRMGKLACEQINFPVVIEITPG